MIVGIGTFVIGVSAVENGDAPAPLPASSLGYRQVEDLATAVGIEEIAGAVIAIIVAEGAPVRYRDDGVDPTRDIGMPLCDNVALLYSAPVRALRFIEQRPSARLNVLYYGDAV